MLRKGIVLDIFEANGKRLSDKAAVREPSAGITLSYAEPDACAGRAAAKLRILMQYSSEPFDADVMENLLAQFSEGLRLLVFSDVSTPDAGGPAG